MSSSGVAQKITVSCRWNPVNLAVSSVFFTADRAYIVRAITSRVDAAGVDVSAVSAVVRKVPSATAVSSGTVLHTGSVNLKGSANTNQAVSLSATASDLALAAGDSLALHLTGTPTTAQGSVTVFLDAA